ncbi:MAG TPA: tail fiber domain-containing protein [Saprospiraceae bacterium]|nr:tail fiber domain-containing protein [Saprospiraceae bacterium]
MKNLTSIRAIRFLLILTFSHSHILTFSQNIGIGLLTPAGKLHVKGSEDASQLIIDANSTQSNTSPLMRLRKSDGNDLMWIHADTSVNLFIGVNAGRVNVHSTTVYGLYNTFIGRDAGYSNSSGNNNTSIGWQSLYFNYTGAQNTAHGVRALYSNTSGYVNTAIGNNALYANTTGHYNTAVGGGALSANTSVSYNTAIGYASLATNSTGFDNTAIGAFSLYSNTRGSENTAIGISALETQSYNPGFNWVSGNVAVGDHALYSNQPTSEYTGVDNTAIGSRALYSNTIGNENTANGFKALFFNTTGVCNTASGSKALYSNTNGYDNTAHGCNALYTNTGGIFNSAFGSIALYSNTIGSDNTAIGNRALNFNTIGNDNTAIGDDALRYNATGSRNTAVGTKTLYSQSWQNGGSEWNSNNTAIGYEALLSNNPSTVIQGIDNTAIGAGSLRTNTLGANNTAIGYHSLYNNDEGSYNTAIGYTALDQNDGTFNTACGTGALYYNVGGYENTALGYNSGTASYASNVWNTISIGNNGWLNGYQNQAFIGNASTGWIGGWVDWTIYSDARIKNNILEDVKGLEFITRLRPVTYHRSIKAAIEISGDKDTKDYPGKYDVEKIRYTGFLAQEVENAALESGYDFSGLHKPKGEHDLYSLTYAEFVVPLVKAVQELNEQLKSEITSLKSQIEKQNTENEILQQRIEKMEILLQIKQ